MSPSRRIREQVDPVAESVALRERLDAAVDELQHFVRELNTYVREAHDDQEREEAHPDE